MRPPPVALATLSRPRTFGYHGVLTVDTTGLMSLYLNGTLRGTAAGNAGLLGGPGSLPFRIGASSYGIASPAFPRYAWRGAIDDVRVYNRVLSSDEVAQLFAYESAPSPCAPRSATATATLSNGFVVGITMTDFGCGYTNTPLVLIEGGGGTGATAAAVVTNGIVASVTITDAGIGYTSPPSVFIGSVPYIVSQPQSVLINYGQNASFSVAAVGSSQIAYQWSLSGTPIAGATNTSLTITNAGPADLGDYAVVVTDPFGSVTSSPAALDMFPYLATSFQGTVAYWGKDAALSVQVYGTGPVTYQWYDNGVAVLGATNRVLDFPSIQLTNGGLYSVVITSPFGSITNVAAPVVVNPAGVSLGLYPGVTISGVVGYTYAIQRTANLTQTNSWVTLTNLTLTQPVQLWLDTSVNATVPANPLQFYQVVPGQ